MDVITGNIKIAEFMAEEDSFLFTSPSYANGSYWVSQKFQCVEDPDGNDLLHPSEMKFNTSWDWLIPVIDKIQSDDTYSKYVDDSTSMFEKGGVFINTKFIDVTYDNVIDFLDWYNNQ